MIKHDTTRGAVLNGAADIPPWRPNEPYFTGGGGPATPVPPGPATPGDPTRKPSEVPREPNEVETPPPREIPRAPTPTEGDRERA